MLTIPLLLALLAPAALAERANHLALPGCSDAKFTTRATQPDTGVAPISKNSPQKLPCPCDRPDDIYSYPIGHPPSPIDARPGVAVSPSTNQVAPGTDDIYSYPIGHPPSPNDARPEVAGSTSTNRVAPGTPGYTPRLQASPSSTLTSLKSGFITSIVPSPTLSKATPSPVSSKPGTAPTPLPPTTSGPKNMLYFGAWSIYGQKFRPQDIPANQVSHILYAFGDIASDGSVISADPWADYQIRFAGDSQESSGANAYGNIKQLYLLKQKHRNLKTLLSIGGFTYSQEGKFQAAANTAAGRQRFASTAVQLMSDWGFDGIDVDWEYPETQTEASNFVLLLQACRAALDKYAKDNNQLYHYPLTIAVSAGPEKYKILDMKAIDKYVDYWNLMAYDYAGPWDTTTGHDANLFPSTTNPQGTKFSTDQAVRDYIKGGVAPGKIILGMPLYGHSFLNTVPQLGQPYQGVASNTGSDPGVWLYRDLPRPGAQVKVDNQAVAAWSYDPTTRELVSFDNIPVGIQKAAYIQKQGLGGAMFWEAAGDKTGDESLVGAVGRAMGSLGVSSNMLDYPKSQYANIRNQMKA